MAKCSCKVKFGSFKWNRAGYVEVANSGDAQSLVEQHAQATYSGCAAKAPGYVMKQVRGRFANGYIVGTGSGESIEDNLRHNTLLNNLR